MDVLSECGLGCDISSFPEQLLQMKVNNSTVMEYCSHNVIVFRLPPEPANIVVAPMNTVVSISFDAVFTCEAFGVPAPTISWSLPDGTENSAMSGSGSGMLNPRISVETNTSDSPSYRVISRLSVESTELGDAGTYTCVAVNGVENLIGATGSATANLTVQGKAMQRTNQSDCQSDVYVGWDLQTESQHFQSIASYFINLWASNGHYSYNLLLSPEPANILVAPMDTVVNVSFDAGFSCEAFGVPTPTISWSLPDGTEVSAMSGSGIGLLYPRISAETSTSDSSAYRVISRLSVDNTEPGDAGTYTCVAVNGVENRIGATGSATATLTIQGKVMQRTY